ncbi:MAG: Uncharacterized protein AWT59_1453 [Candidatus Gallionella acididurans]|uniref:Uncharacterized protein n=1 Tax=Candidatus Gallionella acididurans TaxID=1796491 RepID=A0A139BU43_9PROT|nr:MAG: Uncharacterized protein AWT59_1453 [Candidatus Gallionella acididurans]
MTNKVKIKLVTIGYLPHDFRIDKIKNWKSEVFQLIGNIENFSLRTDSDGERWDFSDSLISEQLPKNVDADFVIALVNVPIEDNWYTRLVGNNQIVFTFHEIKDILEDSHIPLANVVLRLLYAYALVYRQCGNRIPKLNESVEFTHDETRGCVFDMNGIKTDLPASCDKPQICDECQERLKNSLVSNDIIEQSKKEILSIRKEFYYRILEFVKKHPVWALLISSCYALILNIIASIITK